MPTGQARSSWTKVRDACQVIPQLERRASRHPSAISTFGHVMAGVFLATSGIPPPESGHPAAVLGCPLSANRDRPHRSKQRPYSITSSARASRDGGTVRPSALAVVRLTTKSNLAGCSTGRSAGFVPLRNLVDVVAGATEYVQIWSAIRIRRPILLSRWSRGVCPNGPMSDEPRPQLRRLPAFAIGVATASP